MHTAWVQPIILSDDTVRLEPLERRHARDLLEAMDAGTFEYMPSGPGEMSEAGVGAYIDGLNARANHLAFAVVDQTHGRAIGSTSYMAIREAHRGLEIGCTWIAADYRGSQINPRMKYLMLAHAFEALDALRVELRTDALNARSRAAILKLGAREEGVLRAHMIMPSGRVRDTAVYAITAEDWAGVRARLVSRIEENPSHRGSGARD